MDIRHLVNRITDALGPDATPERVEAIAEAVLQGQSSPLHTSPLPARAPRLGERAIVTAYGYDAPGILAAITQAASEAGCNILDVSQKILQGYFTLIMLIDVTQMRPTMRELQERLAQAGEAKGVRVLVQHEDLFNAMQRP